MDVCLQRHEVCFLGLLIENQTLIKMIKCQSVHMKVQCGIGVIG